MGVEYSQNAINGANDSYRCCPVGIPMEDLAALTSIPYILDCFLMICIKRIPKYNKMSNIIQKFCRDSGLVQQFAATERKRVPVAAKVLISGTGVGDAKRVAVLFASIDAQSISTPREAWCILQGESPCRVRINHPLVSSVASVAELLKAVACTKKFTKELVPQGIPFGRRPNQLLSIYRTYRYLGT